MTIFGKNLVTSTITAAFVLALASGCGTNAPTEIGRDLNNPPQAPASEEPTFRGSPDRLEREGNPPRRYNDACVFSPDMAERLGRPACLS